MAGKDKNIRTDLPGFLHYRGREMPGKERNAFERELQKDPFSAEAAEGFNEMEPEVIKNDLQALTMRLKSRTRIKQRIIYYRIAASVAVLMIISSVFIIIQLNKPDKLITENIMGEQGFEISKPSVYREPKTIQDNKIALNETHQEKAQSKDVNPDERIKNNLSEDKVLADQKMAVAGEQVKEIISIPEKRGAEMAAIPAAQTRAMAKADVSIMDAEVPFLIKGKVISAEDNLPIPGAIITVKGTTLGTQTGTGGNFSITLPDQKNYSLIAGFIGMDSKEFSAKGDSVVQIRLTTSQLALNEIVVTGMGEKRRLSKDMTGAVTTVNVAKAAEPVYTPPSPMNGKENFDKYIETNIRKPAGFKTGKSEVVVISFLVKTDGKPDSIKIIRSPGKSFSDEAIRLIKEGPAWVPAEENKIKIEEEVRIRIVFK
jgi:hypothetical protein